MSHRAVLVVEVDVAEDADNQRWAHALIESVTIGNPALSAAGVTIVGLHLAIEEAATGILDVFNKDK